MSDDDDQISNEPEHDDDEVQGGATDDTSDVVTQEGGPKFFPCTELGNAERIVAKYGPAIRYCTPRRKWFAWSGKRWVLDENGVIERIAKQTVRSIKLESATCRDADTREAMEAWARKSESSAKIDAAVRLARSEPGIPVLPTDLDADPWLFNCQNGTIDLKTGELRRQNRADLITKISPVVFDLNARSAVWDTYVHDATGGDEEIEGYLQRVFGYALCGVAIEKKFFFLFGPRDTTKSTFVEAMAYVFGDYAINVAFDTWCEHTHTGGNRGDLVRLMGARLAYSVETRKGKRFDEALLKNITGGDAITESAKFEAEVTFKPACTLVLAANDPPKFRDDDDALADRIARIPFSHVIKNPDIRFREKLKVPDVAAAALAWAVHGGLDWQRYGLQEPKLIAEERAAYVAEQDRLGPFLHDCCVLEQEARATRKELRDAYLEHCKQNHRTPISDSREFTKCVRAKTGIEESSVRDANGNPRDGWQGIRLKNAAERNS